MQQNECACAPQAVRPNERLVWAEPREPIADEPSVLGTPGMPGGRGWTANVRVCRKPRPASKPGNPIRAEALPRHQCGCAHTLRTIVGIAVAFSTSSSILPSPAASHATPRHATVQSYVLT